MSGFQERASRISPTEPILSPRVLISNIKAAYVGPGMNLSPHKNAVATIAVALTGSLDLDLTGPDERCLQGVGAALIPADTLHHLRSTGGMVFIYIDPLSDDTGPELQDRDLASWDRAALRVIDVVSRLESLAGVEAQIAALCDAIGLSAKATSDDRLELAIRAIDRHPARFDSVERAADLAGLSTSRFQHLFRETTGTSFRRYRLWKRMAVVARSLKRGDSLTTAALDAGFSSSAHLSSTFRRMFGIKPSDLISQEVQFCVDEPDPV